MTSLPATAAGAAHGHRQAAARPGMIWVAWRQHRAGLAVLLAAAAALAGASVYAGWHIHAAYAAIVAQHCLTRPQAPCGDRMNAFAGYNQAALPVALHLAPALIAAFLGAPLLAREAEQATWRFAFTQGVSRIRWVIVKLLLLAAGVTTVACGLALLARWWLAPFEGMSQASPWQAGLFELGIPSYAGLTLAVFTAAVLAGGLIRRTVPAIAAGLAAAAALTLALWWKLTGVLLTVAPLTASTAPHYSDGYVLPADPGHAQLNAMAGPSAGRLAGSWLLQGWFTGPGGRPLSPQAMTFLLRRLPTASGAQLAWLARRHERFWVSYQPPGRYWYFQAGAGAALLAAALALGCCVIWLVRRRDA